MIASLDPRLDRFVTDAQQDASPILDAAVEAWSATPAQPLLLTGAADTGRAGALCRFAARRMAAGDGVALHHATLTASSAEPAQLLWRLLVEMRRIAGIPEWPPPLAVDMREALPNWLARASARGPLWLIIADLDATADDDGHVAWLPEYWPPNLRMVASSGEGACAQRLIASGWRSQHVTGEIHAPATPPAPSVRRAQPEAPTWRTDPVSVAVDLRRAGRRERALDTLMQKEALLATETPAGRMRWLAEWEALHAGSLRDVLIPMLLVAEPRHWLAAAELVDAVGEDVPADWLDAAAAGTNPGLCARARLWQARLAARIDDWTTAAERAQAAMDLTQDQQLRARAHHELARAAEGAGDLQRATTLYGQALQRQETRHGKDSVALLPALANLVGVLRAAHQLNRAAQVARRAMEIARAGYGLAHPATAAAYDQQAAVAYAQADYAQAETAYRETLRIVEAGFGPRHPATAAALHNLGTVLDARRAFVEAEACYRRALAIREAAYGREHEDTAATLHNLAATLETVGRPDEAERLYRETTDIWEKLHGAEHPATLSSLTNLAGVLGARGAWADAEVCYRAAAAGWQRVLGAEHANTLATLAELGRLYAEGGRPELAGPLLEHVVETTVRVLGVADPHHVNSVCALAALWRDQGRGDDARNLLNEALAGAAHELGLLAPPVQTLRRQLDTL